MLGCYYHKTYVHYREMVFSSHSEEAGLLATRVLENYDVTEIPSPLYTVLCRLGSTVVSCSLLCVAHCRSQPLPFEKQMKALKFPLHPLYTPKRRTLSCDSHVTTATTPLPPITLPKKIQVSYIILLVSRLATVCVAHDL